MFKSYLNGITDMVGDFAPKEIYSIYAAPNVGKTIYLIGEAINALNQGQRVIWIDTEGGFDNMWSKFAPIYAQRFNYNLANLDQNYEYYRVITPQELSALFGFNIDVEYDKKISTKITSINKKSEGTLYEHWGNKKKDLLIILDSFSSPFKLGFSMAVENFSARADAQSIIFMGIMQFMEKTSATVIMSHHSSMNPTNPYEQVGKVRGGTTVMYYSKYILDFEAQKRKALSDYRHVFAVRTSKAKSWELSRWFKIDGNGYNDASDAEVTELIGAKHD